MFNYELELNFIPSEIVESADSGEAGKRLEKNFYKVLDLVGLEYALNGKQGSQGRLWDFTPTGDGWKNIPPGAKVNLKSFNAATTGSRTLWTLADVWKDIFERDYKPTDNVNNIIKRRLLRIKFHDVYWLVPSSKDVEFKINDAAKSGDKNSADRVLRSNNWSLYKLGSQFTINYEMDNGRVTSLHLLKGGRKFAQIRKRQNKRAGSTGAWARKTSTKLPTPFKSLKENLTSSDLVDALLS